MDHRPPPTGQGLTRMQERGPHHAVTQALFALRRGEPGAMDQLMPLVYEELRRMAHRQLGAEPAGHTLSSAALVNEAYLRLVDQRQAQWSDRAQFFAVASRIMRRVLIDYARRHRALRRGGPEGRPVALDALDEAGLPAQLVAPGVVDRAESLLALDEALERLGTLDDRLARVVECRFFGGLTEEETAAALEISQRTVARAWRTARAWLHHELHQDLS